MFLLQFNMPDRNPRLGGKCRRHSVRNGMLKSNKDT